jgi:serine/threonine protein kinase
MAPERFSGWFDELSDLYSLGITLYELVTQRPAFEATGRLTLVEAITAVGPTPPRKIDREIPRDLETIILQAIRRDPEERYYSVEAFVADLLRFMNGKRIRAKRPSRWRNWLKRWNPFGGKSPSPRHSA